MQTESGPSTGAAQWAVFGHTWAVQMLQRAAEPSARGAGARTGPNHAYLFLGAPQVGKTTLARAFVRALLCESGDRRPCGRCRACMLLERGNHPDFCLLQATDKEGAVDRLNGELRTERAVEIVR